MIGSLWLKETMEGFCGAAEEEDHRKNKKCQQMSLGFFVLVLLSLLLFFSLSFDVYHLLSLAFSLSSPSTSSSSEGKTFEAQPTVDGDGACASRRYVTPHFLQEEGPACLAC